MKRIFAALLAAFACAGAAPAAAQTLEEALDHFYAQRYDTSRAAFQALVQRHPDDAGLRVWLGQARYRVDDLDGALVAAREALAMEPCLASAHSLIALLHMERWRDEAAGDSSQVHARRGIECDPGDGNAWIVAWSQAMDRRDSTAIREAAQQLATLAFVPPAEMEHARWVLRSAPEGAVIVTDGDWDYFPMRVAQIVEGLRPDVYVVLRPYMDFPWYLRQVVRETGLPLPPQVAELGDDEWIAPAPESPGGLPFHAGTHWGRATLAGAARPLVIARTARVDLVEAVAWPRWDGPLYTLRPRSEAPEESGRFIHPASFAASMRNLRIELLGSPVVHPGDHSPVRRATRHPAETILISVACYGVDRFNAGDLAGARQALAWGDALIATGRVGAARAALLVDLRDAVAAAAP